MNGPEFPEFQFGKVEYGTFAESETNLWKFNWLNINSLQTVKLLKALNVAEVVLKCMGLRPMHFNRQNSDVCRKEWKNVEMWNFAEIGEAVEA